MPAEDALSVKGLIRSDGRKIYPAYLFELKGPADSSGRWNYYKLESTTTAEEAFAPPAQSRCPLAAVK
jgi:branched-chain amino acid transport system substrate-binding protein